MSRSTPQTILVCLIALSSQQVYAVTGGQSQTMETASLICSQVMFKLQKFVTWGRASPGCAFICEEEARLFKWALEQSDLVRTQSYSPQCNFDDTCLSWNFMALGEISLNASSGHYATMGSRNSYDPINQDLSLNTILYPAPCDVHYNMELVEAWRKAETKWIERQEDYRKAYNAHAEARKRQKMYKPKPAGETCLCYLDITFEKFARNSPACSFDGMKSILTGMAENWMVYPVSEAVWTGQQTHVFETCAMRPSSRCPGVCMPRPNFSHLACLPLNPTEPSSE